MKALCGWMSVIALISYIFALGACTKEDTTPAPPPIPTAAGRILCSLDGTAYLVNTDPFSQSSNMLAEGIVSARVIPVPDSNSVCFPLKAK